MKSEIICGTNVIMVLDGRKSDPVNNTLQNRGYVCSYIPRLTNQPGIPQILRECTSGYVIYLSGFTNQSGISQSLRMSTSSYVNYLPGFTHQSCIPQILRVCTSSYKRYLHGFTNQSGICTSSYMS